MEAGLDQNKSKNRLKFLALILIPVISFFFSITLERYSITVADVFKILFAKLIGKSTSYPDVLETVIFNIKIPRIIASMIIGSYLSISGSVYQGMFKNLMVSKFTRNFSRCRIWSSIRYITII